MPGHGHLEPAAQALAADRDEHRDRALEDAHEQRVEAAFFEGFWSDHWEYNLDLIESYLAIFPDRQEELLFGEPGLPFFDSPAARSRRPRSRRTSPALESPSTAQSRLCHRAT